MPEQIAGPRPQSFVPPVDVSRAMNTADPKEIFRVRTSLLRRIKFLTALVSEGRGEENSPGAERLTVLSDVASLYGQLNALNARLAGFQESPSILPYDPSGAAMQLWNNDGTVSSKGRGLVNSIQNEEERRILAQALTDVGEFSAFTTAYLWSTGRPKIEALKGPIVPRSYEKVYRAIANAAAVLSGEDPNLVGKKYGVTNEEVANAKKDPRWDEDVAAAFEYAVEEDVILITEAVPEGKSRVDARIEELQQKIAELRRKGSLSPMDRMQLVRWNDEIMKLRQQKGR